jgi:phage terminase large subunit-like protein
MGARQKTLQPSESLMWKKLKMLIKQELDKWLDSVDYSHLNSSEYVPSQFSLLFTNFIKLVNGTVGETHLTPPVHLKMLDKMTTRSDYVANLIFRGAAKTTLFMEYLTLYLAMFNEIPGFGEVTGMIYVSDSMENGVKSARKNIEFRYEKSDFLKEWIPEARFTDPYLEFTNRAGKQLGVRLFGAKTGLRGTKIFGKRPTLCVLDDLVSDEDSKSRVSMEAIKDTVYKGVNHALDPTKRKVIFNGTPFNKDDILIEAVESGAWDVNVYPVCERFPCRKEEFRGAWEDRFTYEYVSQQYDIAVKTGKVAGFNQELMLRLTSEEERLIQDSDIRWFDHTQIMATNNRHNFNFYITTDFATSGKQTADFSVISVWAYNAQGDWFWVDGVCERQTIDKSFNDLFRLVQEYKPQAVGVEVSGQQQAYIKLLQAEMLNRNVWFTFASSEKSGEPGIRPVVDKLSRLNLVVPWFKAGKMYFPSQMKESRIMGICMGQVALATKSGLKGKDDFLDTISQLGYLAPWKPSESAPVVHHDNIWEIETPQAELSPMVSYVV